MKKIEEPLFTSYVFANISEKERLDILQYPGIVRSVFWLNKPVRIRDEEIENIKSFLKENPEAFAQAIDLHKGESVDIVDGILKDNTAIIENVKKNRVKLHLTSLGFELIAEVDISHVKRNTES